MPQKSSQEAIDSFNAINAIPTGVNDTTTQVHHKKLDETTRVIHERSYPNDKMYSPYELRRAYQSTPVVPLKDKRKVVITIAIASPVSAEFLQECLDGFCRAYDLPLTTLEVVPMPTISQLSIDFFNNFVTEPLKGYLNSESYKSSNMFNEADFVAYFKTDILSDYDSTTVLGGLIDDMLVAMMHGLFENLTETLIDIQWSYAMNPHAHIRVVQSESMNTIFDTVQFASDARNFSGVATDIISMSWHAPESALTQSKVDIIEGYFSNDKICYLSSSGDQSISNAGAFPSSSANVLSVGGTSLYFNPVSDVMSQTTWYWDNNGNGAGCGFSTYSSKPAYQSKVNLGNTQRCTPDICGIADPNTGVAICFAGDDTKINAKYMIVGGTSLACPLNAGMLSNVIQSFINHDSSMVLTTVNNPTSANSVNLQTMLYDIYHSSVAAEFGLYSKCFYDVTVGSNGIYNTANGYDVATGLGSLYYDKFIDLFFDFAVFNKLKLTTDQKNIIKRQKIAMLNKYLNSV